MEEEFLRAPCRGLSAGLVWNMEWTGRAELGQQQTSWRDHRRQAIWLDGFPGAQHAHPRVSSVFGGKGLGGRVHGNWGRGGTRPAAFVFSIRIPVTRAPEVVSRL